MDAHDPTWKSTSSGHSFARKRSKIMEIVATSNIIFGLTQTGLCSAFDQVRLQNYFYNQIIDSILLQLPAH